MNNLLVIALGGALGSITRYGYGRGGLITIEKVDVLYYQSKK